MKVTLSAITPTNQITIGNFFGALRFFKNSENNNERFLYGIVDYHAISTPQDPKQLADSIVFLGATFLSMNLLSSNSYIFLQSYIPEHLELAWLLTHICHTGELSRMTQFKEKSQLHNEAIPVGLFYYPILMAADILLYNTNFVPVGEDQKQHVEITRDLAIRFNHKYGSLFTVPEAVIAKEGAKIMDLREPSKKMSKSRPTNGGIFITDSDDTIVSKLKKAVTDSNSEIKQNSNIDLGISNLLAIYACASSNSVEKIQQQFIGKSYGTLKLETAAKLIAYISPIRTKINDYLKNKDFILKVLKEESIKTRVFAQEKLNKIKQTLGFPS